MCQQKISHTSTTKVGWVSNYCNSLAVEGDYSGCLSNLRCPMTPWTFILMNQGTKIETSRCVWEKSLWHPNPVKFTVSFLEIIICQPHEAITNPAQFPQIKNNTWYVPVGKWRTATFLSKLFSKSPFGSTICVAKHLNTRAATAGHGNYSEETTVARVNELPVTPQGLSCKAHESRTVTFPGNIHGTRMYIYLRENHKKSPKCR